MDYNNKYKKYKNKYINLKNQYAGSNSIVEYITKKITENNTAEIAKSAIISIDEKFSDFINSMMDKSDSNIKIVLANNIKELIEKIHNESNEQNIRAAIKKSVTDFSEKILCNNKKCTNTLSYNNGIKINDKEKINGKEMKWAELSLIEDEILVYLNILRRVLVFFILYQGYNNANCKNRNEIDKNNISDYCKLGSAGSISLTSDYDINALINLKYKTEIDELSKIYLENTDLFTLFDVNIYIVACIDTVPLSYKNILTTNNKNFIFINKSADFYWKYIIFNDNAKLNMTDNKTINKVSSNDSKNVQNYWTMKKTLNKCKDLTDKIGIECINKHKTLITTNEYSENLILDFYDSLNEYNFWSQEALYSVALVVTLCKRQLKNDKFKYITDKNQLSNSLYLHNDNTYYLTFEIVCDFIENLGEIAKVYHEYNSNSISNSKSILFGGGAKYIYRCIDSLKHFITLLNIMEIKTQNIDSDIESDIDSIYNKIDTILEYKKNNKIDEST